MGVSTDANLCYGFHFEESYELPWDAEKYDGCIDAWWMDVNGYVNPIFNPFTDEGNYKEGVKSDDPRISEYFEHQRKWLKENPMPVEEIFHCADECPMVILAVPDTSKTANRGSVVTVNPGDLKVDQDKVSALIDFCYKYNIETLGNPNWLLTSYWG